MFVEKNCHVKKFQLSMYMTIVGKLKISPLVEKFQMSPHDKNKQCVQLTGFYCNLCCFVAKSFIHAVLSRNLFCHNLRAFMWRKIEPKSTFVKKKWQISGLMLGSFGFSISYFERDVREEHVSNITISNKVICGWVIFVHIIVKSLPTTLEMISDNKFQNTMRYCTIPQSTLHSI